MRSFWMALFLLVAGVPCIAASAGTYDALIRGARDGHYEPALVMLREYGKQHPADLRAIYDHILIAQWAGKDGEVLAVYEASRPLLHHMPSAALSAVARANRDTKRWSDALAFYREGKRRFPRDPAFAIGEAMVLADSGQASQAIAAAQRLVDTSPENSAYRLTLEYAYHRAGLRYDALHEADLAHTLDPRKTATTREYILSLQRAGLPGPALQMAQSHPTLLNNAETRRLEGDYAAQLVRLASAPSREESNRFAIADRALALYDKLIRKWQSLGPVAHDDLVRVRIDRLAALQARARMRDVVTEYQQLLAEGITVPDYALSTVAASYLSLHQPKKARDLYRRILDDETSRQGSAGQRISDEMGLFYSLIDSGSYDEANRLIQAARAKQGTWRYYKGLPEPAPNESKLAVEKAAALGLYYANDTGGAQRRLSEMVDHAPMNTDLRAALATVDRGRNQPRRAEIGLKMAETVDPRDVTVESGQGQTALALQEWREAEQLSKDTLTREPENLDAQSLAQDWRIHNMAELRISGYRGITTNSPVSGNGDFGIDSVLYSPPIDYNWRVFGGGGYANGNFEEGQANYRWLRTGVEWRGRDTTVEAEASTNNYGYGVKPGVRLTASYDLGDAWQIGGSGEILSRSTPLRALLHDVSSNNVSAYVSWHPNEQREWRVAFTPSHFSDGNSRYEVDMTGRERLYTASHFNVDFGLNVAASHNSSVDAVYFNPRADLTVLPTVSLTQTLYQHYDTSLEHKITLGAGTYSQQGFGTKAIAAVSYGLTFRTSKVFEIGATVTGISRPYDGVRERDFQVVVNMIFRF